MMIETRTDYCSGKMIVMMTRTKSWRMTCCSGRKSGTKKRTMKNAKRPMMRYCFVMTPMIRKRSYRTIQRKMNWKKPMKSVMLKNCCFLRTMILRCWDRLQAHSKPAARCREYTPLHPDSGW